MPRKKKKRAKKVYSKKNFQLKFSESYVSLLLGFFIVFVASFLVLTFSKNRTYDRINTAVSTYEQLTAQQTEEKKQKTYEVKPGDNLWKIAENVYGSGYNWVDLAKANNLKNPGIIHVGNKLIVPDVPKITVATVQPMLNKGPSISENSYKIQKGDNLWDISIRKYGDGYKWPEIAKVNSIPNPDLIYANTVLKLP